MAVKEQAKSVFSDRLATLRDGLSQAEFDAFVSVSPPTNQYLTGFQGTTSGVIVTATDALFLCDFRYTEQANETVTDYSVHEVSGGITKRLGERLTELGVATAAFEPQYMTVDEKESIDKPFDGKMSGVAIASPASVARMRQFKSLDEIEAIRSASQLAESVLADLVETLSAGMTEEEFAAEMEFEFKRRGAQGPSFDTIALFGRKSSLPHGRPTDKPLERGDVVLIDFGCRRAGYCSDLTRTYAYGTIPGAWFEEVYELTLTAQKLAIEAVRPGMSCRELDAVARDLISEAGHGKHFGHGLGHGVGIEIHEAPRLNPESATILETGMVVTIEPGVYLPGKGGIRIEDIILVTKDGGELLSGTPKELRILSV
jgi:Xaa-Pro aminopeptidase